MSPTSSSSLTGVEQSDVQPNAVDLRLGKVFRIKDRVFSLDNDNKQHRGSEEILPDEDGFYTLYPGSYEIVMENIITVGPDEAGWVITRSTLIRNDLFIRSGLYDSMYSGAMGAVLEVGTGVARIKKGTRIGQYMCFKAEALHGYSGSYGFDAQGKPRPDEEKYHK